MKGLILITGMVGIISGQTIDDLSDEQKREFNRAKISIEVIGQSTGNIGGYGSGLFGATFQSTSWFQWAAYQGMGKQLTEADFFTLTGYDDEAQKAAERAERINNSLVYGSIAGLGGLIAMSISKTTTKVEHYSYGNAPYEYSGSYEYEDTTYPFIVPGAIIGFVGLVMVYAAAMGTRINWAPVSTVQQITDDYNQQVIRELLASGS